MMKKFLQYNYVFGALLIVIFLINVIFAANINGTGNNEAAIGSHVVYLSPLPGSKYITPQSNIILKGDDNIDPASLSDNKLFSVTGSVSGLHQGKIVLSDDNRTVLFKPSLPFAFGEVVTVKLNGGIKTVYGDSITLAQFNFSTSKNNANLNYNFTPNNFFVGDQVSSTNLNLDYSQQNKAVKVSNSSNLPADFPPLTIKTSNGPSRGYLFLASYVFSGSSPYGNYLVIADNSGNVLYYKKTDKISLDFKIQPTGVVTYFQEGVNRHYVMNSSLNIIDSITCGNGYENDAHDLRILPDGHILLLCDDYETVDMSKIVPGGDTAATVLGNIVQELDKNRNVVFQWRSWDHYNITDAVHENLKAHTIDCVHANALDLDSDGNILLSARQLDEITKIDINTGDIIWRLGGIHNQFNFVNDTIGFSEQHALRKLSNGDITLFDNGNFHNPPFSRAVEYKLDETNKTATLVWQYRNNPDLYAYAMGYVQRLSNGNTMIGWGTANATVSEVTPKGEVALEMDFPQGVWGYRAYRFPFLLFDTDVEGQSLQKGNDFDINWNSSGIDSVNIDYSTDAGKTWKNIISNYPAHQHSFTWTVPDISSNLCKIRISKAGTSKLPVAFISDSTFSINNTVGVNPVKTPDKYYLEDNYPNPFNPSTTINYHLATDSKVIIRIFNTLGQLVREIDNSDQSAGSHTYIFNASNLPSGVYFDSIQAYSLDGKQKFKAVNKMMLLK